jgi:hypothetical protein
MLKALARVHLKSAMERTETRPDYTPRLHRGQSTSGNDKIKSNYQTCPAVPSMS